MKKPPKKRIAGLRKKQNANISLGLNNSVSTYGKIQTRLLGDEAWFNLSTSTGQTENGRKISKDIFGDSTNSLINGTLNQLPSPTESHKNNGVSVNALEDSSSDQKVKQSKARATQPRVRKKQKPEKRKKAKKAPKNTADKENVGVAHEMPTEITGTGTNGNIRKSTDPIAETDICSTRRESVDMFQVYDEPVIQAHQSQITATNLQKYSVNSHTSPNARETNDRGSAPQSLEREDAFSPHTDKTAPQAGVSTRSMQANASMTSSLHMSLNSTVLHHAANIDMTDAISNAGQPTLLHLSTSQALPKRQAMAQSTPMGNGTGRVCTRASFRLQTSVALGKKAAANFISEVSKQKVAAVVPKPNDEPPSDSQAFSITSNAQHATTNGVNAPSQNLIKPPKLKKPSRAKKAPKPKLKKAPVWKKCPGSMMRKKFGSLKSNDSILSRIMTGEPIQPNPISFDDSCDVFQVKNTSDGSVIKLPGKSPPPQIRDKSPPEPKKARPGKKKKTARKDRVAKKGTKEIESVDDEATLEEGSSLPNKLPLPSAGGLYPPRRTTRNRLKGRKTIIYDYYEESALFSSLSFFSENCPNNDGGVCDNKTAGEGGEGKSPSKSDGGNLQGGRRMALRRRNNIKNYKDLSMGLTVSSSKIPADEELSRVAQPTANCDTGPDGVSQNRTKYDVQDPGASPKSSSGIGLSFSEKSLDNCNNRRAKDSHMGRDDTNPKKRTRMGLRKRGTINYKDMNDGNFRKMRKTNDSHASNITASMLESESDHTKSPTTEECTSNPSFQYKVPARLEDVSSQCAKVPIVTQHQYVSPQAQAGLPHTRTVSSEGSILSSPDDMRTKSGNSNSSHHAILKNNDPKVSLLQQLNQMVTRNRRGYRNTESIPVSHESTMFSSLSFASEKQTTATSMSVPMHAFSTINKTEEDGNIHGDILSDDDEVNEKSCVGGRVSTPIVSSAPSNPVTQLYANEVSQAVQHDDKCDSHEKVQSPPASDVQDLTRQQLQHCSPIAHASPPMHASSSTSSQESPSEPIEPRHAILHPRISLLRGRTNTSTPHSTTRRATSTPDSARINGLCGKGGGGVSTASKYPPTFVSPNLFEQSPETVHTLKKMPLTREGRPISCRKRARSPGSISTPPVVLFDSINSPDCFKGNRRRTCGPDAKDSLNDIKINLYSVIEPKDSALDDVSSRDMMTSNHTQSKVRFSMPCFDAKVLMTPLSNSLLARQYATRRYSFKSLGFVDALTPKRVRDNGGRVLTAREKVLYECDQLEPVPFEQALEGLRIDTCVKVGEGLYGEVFRCSSEDGPESIAIKVIPIEGKIIVNNEKQKTFEEMLPEIISSKELHGLREAACNQTDGFIELYKITCAIGAYPQFLIDSWDRYDDERTSENDRPDNFGEEQLFLIFQFADGGADVEHFKFKNASQGFSVIQQVCASLAVAEEALQFEHRDLHWGNVLVSNTKEKTLSFTLDNKVFTIQTNGVKASIIDFTLSRLSKGGVTVFQDLAMDPELFSLDAGEDYQFEIYRLMKKATKNRWSRFQPKTNIFWIHYLNDKLHKEVAYSHKKMKLHRSHCLLLNRLSEDILNYSSCSAMILSSDILNLLEPS